MTLGLSFLIFDNLWYHTTPKKNLKNILKNGLKINSNHKGFTISPIFPPEHYYGLNPVFIKTYPERYDGEDNEQVVELVLDLSSYVDYIAADIPSLADFGAYLEEDHLWFKEGSNPFDEDEEEISYEDLLQGGRLVDQAIRITKTAVCLVNISPEFIKRFDSVS